MLFMVVERFKNWPAFIRPGQHLKPPGLDGNGTPVVTQPVGQNMNHQSVLLHNAFRVNQAGPQDGFAEGLKGLRPNDQIGYPGLVFQGDEHRALGTARPLAIEPGIAIAGRRVGRVRAPLAAEVALGFSPGYNADALDIAMPAGQRPIEPAVLHGPSLDGEAATERYSLRALAERFISAAT